ncbi:MAG TPA: metalloregulator ArsR/SmtB family transcription factor [Gemmatimonadales bacterium]|nr:metalloregulator ArsR/SmtB family transcription factor [Gemmatimonadales bacterium]
MAHVKPGPGAAVAPAQPLLHCYMVICPGSADPLPRKPLSPEQLGLIAERFKALSEPSRLEILNTLREGERTVSEILEVTGLGQANVSKHLQLLHASGFVERRKDGVSIYYRLADGDVLRLCELMCGRLEEEARVKRKLFAPGR